MIAGALAAPALAGCGDEEEPATADPSTTTATEPPAETELSKVRAEFNAQLESLLAARYQLTPEQADCAIGHLNETIAEADVKRALKTGEPSQEFLQAAFEAGEECGAE